MIKKAFNKQKNCLVYFGIESSQHFWDERWNDKNSNLQFNKLIANITSKFLSPPSRILEGGCGKGHIVFTLNKMGYNVSGIDYASRTIKKVNINYPYLDIKHGDIRKMNYKNNTFDGYWSLGVIEHFQNGYIDIAQEAKRVIKNNGYFFLTVPSFSLIRKWKSKLNLYTSVQGNVDNFYQYALDEKEILHNFNKLNFQIKKIQRLDGVKGLKDEVSFLRRILKIVYNSNNIILKTVRKLINICFSWFSNHITLYVFQVVK